MSYQNKFGVAQKLTQKKRTNKNGKANQLIKKKLKKRHL